MFPFTTDELSAYSSTPHQHRVTVPLCFYFQGASEFTLWRGCPIIFKYNYYEKRLMMSTISFAFSVFLFTMTDIDSAVSDVRFALSIIS